MPFFDGVQPELTIHCVSLFVAAADAKKTEQAVKKDAAGELT